MNNEYINNIQAKRNKDKEKDNYIFGLILGTILLYSSFMVYLHLRLDDSRNIIAVFGLVFSSIMIILATVYPNILDKFVKLIKFVAGKVGKILLTIILTVIYFILVSPVGYIINRKNKNNEKLNSAFTIYDKSSITSKSKGILKVLSIIKIFTDERYVLMIPFLILIIILGIFLFFSQSTLIAPFIYTLF